MGPVLIRPAGGDDVDALRDIFRRSSLSNAGDRANLLAHPEVLELYVVPVIEGRTRVAVADGRIIGFATGTLGEDAVELDDLFVAPESMRQGVGTALVQDAVAIARGLGASRLEVTANDHALAFYRSVGFVEVGTVETQFAPAARMCLDLGGRATNS